MHRRHREQRPTRPRGHLAAAQRPAEGDGGALAARSVEHRQRFRAALQHEARDRGAEFELLLARQALQVDVDPVQVQQVVLNLLLNALDASAEQPAERRRVVVRTRASGSSAEAMVRDRGCGVSAEARPHLFEPFYTTKPAGLGMGLSISRSIAESHGGRILMEPAEVGSVFRLVLPLARRTTVAPRDVA